MKKLLLATAVATASLLSAGAHAGGAVSIITSIGLDVFDGTSYIPSATDCTALAAPYSPAAPNALSIFGTSTAALNFVGNVCLDIGGGMPYVSLAFGLTGHAVSGGPEGSLFDGGQVTIETNFGTGWIAAGSVDASVDNIACYGTRSSPTVDGIIWPTTSPSSNAVAIGDDACQATLFGLPAILHLGGTLYTL